jgi:hypothetical protein
MIVRATIGGHWEVEPFTTLNADNPFDLLPVSGPLSSLEHEPGESPGA